MTTNLLPKEIRELYEVHEWKHACAVLKADYAEQWEDIIRVLRDFRLAKEDIVSPGGGLSQVSKRINQGFRDRGWVEKAFQTAITVDDRQMISPTHKVDCVKGAVALEVEWSNKDPFYDRDLNNFRLLFDLRAISVGVIITKSEDLVDLFQGLGQVVWNKFGRSTTWMGKLLPRLEGGGGGGCPVLAFGITRSVYTGE